MRRKKTRAPRSNNKKKYEDCIKDLLNQAVKVRTRRVSDGETVAFGYRPDCVYRRDSSYWIIEIEASTNRKSYLGGYLKAQKYLHESGRSGNLLFIIKRSDQSR